MRLAPKRLLPAIAAWCAILIFQPHAQVGAQQATVGGRVEVDKADPRNRDSDASNVVVWLTPTGESSAGMQPTNLPRQRVRLLQKNKSFQPHILVAPAGADVEFPNADPFFHNVFSLFEGKRFDLGLYEAGTTRTLRFDRPGISYIFCNIHPEMSAIIVILKTPYYSVSDRAGKIAIPGVPAGKYVLEVWDEAASPESLTNLQREIVVSNQSSSLGVIHLARNRTLHVEHKNKYGLDYETPTPANPAYKQPP